MKLNKDQQEDLAALAWLREQSRASDERSEHDRELAERAAALVDRLIDEVTAAREQVERMADRGTLAEVCRALGWQGGTIHQVLDEVRKLRGTVALRLGKVTRVIGEGGHE